MFAPADFRKFVRSFISGSIAQFFKVVFPCARVAAIIEFSVAPTLILGNFIRQPLSGDNLIYRSKECYPKVLTNGRVEYECATYFTCGCNSQKSDLTKNARDYANRVNIECELVQFIIADSGQGLAKTYLNMIYKWVASIIGIIAVIYIIINGIIISTAQNDSGQVAEAKKRIFQSLASLAILMAASIILYAINPTFFIIPADTPTSTSASSNP